ncbi:MAG: hypothetical protein ACXW2E_01540 [Nitrososphaeraceae archaeon]
MLTLLLTLYFLALFHHIHKPRRSKDGIEQHLLCEDPNTRQLLNGTAHPCPTYYNYYDDYFVYLEYTNIQTGIPLLKKDVSI